MIALKKTDVAKRLLINAIELFFDKKDAVSIYLLAASGYQILSDICKKERIHRQLEDNDIFKKLKIDKQIRNSFKKPLNFFKHADSDPDGAINFNPAMVEAMLALGVDLLERLTGEKNIEFKIYKGWFLLKYPEALTFQSEEMRQFYKNIPLPDPNDIDYFRQILQQEKQNNRK